MKIAKTSVLYTIRDCLDRYVYIERDKKLPVVSVAANFLKNKIENLVTSLALNINGLLEQEGAKKRFQKLVLPEDSDDKEGIVAEVVVAAKDPDGCSLCWWSRLPSRDQDSEGTELLAHDHGGISFGYALSDGCGFHFICLLLINSSPWPNGISLPQREGGPFGSLLRDARNFVVVECKVDVFSGVRDKVRCSVPPRQGWFPFDFPSMATTKDRDLMMGYQALSRALFRVVLGSTRAYDAQALGFQGLRRVRD
ncbi:hypothetical protein VNO78_23770 [Psophocarpus tetragonolobus]|uniref:Uncharacterized protein n=1 Tax=Psophocarpus tetragonolobus TaxID=3891 RepID=A0AAN9S4L3_PSOTE